MIASDLASTIKEDAKKWTKEALGEDTESILHFIIYPTIISVWTRSVSGKHIMLTYDRKTGRRIPPHIPLSEEFLTSSDKLLRRLAQEKFGINPLS